MSGAAEFRARFSGREPGPLGIRDYYAVLCPLVEQADGLHLLYEQRAARLRRQPGEVCFPGGRREAGETPERCALRETEEELQIPAREVELLGRADFICSPAGFLLQPVVGLVSPAGFAALRPSPDEVELSFTVPVSFFESQPPAVYYYHLRPDVPADFPFDQIGFPQGYRFQGSSVEEPVWHYNGHIIWGLTARITRSLIHTLRRPDGPEKRSDL